MYAGGSYGTIPLMRYFSSSLRLLFSTLEGSASQVSEQGLRKALYQKILAAFPEGWMSSGQISREGERVKSASYDVVTILFFLKPSERYEKEIREGSDGG
jgi:hypothetical protein